jgi:hypothetical protein
MRGELENTQLQLHKAATDRREVLKLLEIISVAPVDVRGVAGLISQSVWFVPVFFICVRSFTSTFNAIAGESLDGFNVSAKVEAALEKKHKLDLTSKHQQVEITTCIQLINESLKAHILNYVYSNREPRGRTQPKQWQKCFK